MTKEEISILGCQAGLSSFMYPELISEADWIKMKIFVKLIAEHEREACAQICDDKVDAEYATGKVDHNEMGWTQSCAIDIRARGNK